MNANRQADMWQSPSDGKRLEPLQSMDGWPQSCAWLHIAGQRRLQRGLQIDKLRKGSTCRKDFAAAALRIR